MKTKIIIQKRGSPKKCRHVPIEKRLWNFGGPERKLGSSYYIERTYTPALDVDELVYLIE